VDQAGVEQEPIRRGDHSDLDVVAERVLDGDGGGQTAEVSSQNQDSSGHGALQTIRLIPHRVSADLSDPSHL
jgi:hypothetical protein